MAQPQCVKYITKTHQNCPSMSLLRRTCFTNCFSPERTRGIPYHDVTWVLKYLNSLATQMFVKQLVQDIIKENIKALHYWPFLRGINHWLVDSIHKRPVMWKAFLPRQDSHEFSLLCQISFFLHCPVSSALYPISSHSKDGWWKEYWWHSIVCRKWSSIHGGRWQNGRVMMEYQWPHCLQRPQPLRIHLHDAYWHDRNLDHSGLFN